jgi:hypothetical protein
MGKTAQEHARHGLAHIQDGRNRPVLKHDMLFAIQLPKFMDAPSARWRGGLAMTRLQ